MNNILYETSEYEDYEAFVNAKDKIIGKAHNNKGIGTLSEKTLHAVLKLYYEPDEDKHEVAMSGYYADIYNDKGIIEIQTRQLNKLRDKLSVFLQDYHVTVVYPLPFNKWLSWVNPDNGEVQGRRKSPRHFTEYDAFYELYKIKSYLKNPNLSINLVLMDMEEYKLLNGWSYDKKRGSTRYDRVPVGIRRIVKFDRIEDYMQLVPADLKEDFTVKDFAMAAGVSVEASRYTLNILNYLEIVKRTGRVKNGYVYTSQKNFNIMSAKEKEAAAKQTFTFLAPLTNEQSCEAGRKSAISTGS